MQSIKRISEMIEEEIEDASRYADCALKHKNEDSELAETFYALSTEELRHMSMLHDQVVRMINEYKAKHGNPPEGMLAIYNYLHERHIDDVMEVKARQMMYKADG